MNDVTRTSKELTQQHRDALQWARNQSYGSVAARYAKLCAEAFDIASTTQEPPADQLPSAWIKGHTMHTDAGIEYDEEVVPGSDRPKGDGWHPLYSRPSQPPSPSPLAKVAAAFAGKVKDSYILKLWFESQEDLDAAFDMVDDVNPILPSVPDSDPTKCENQFKVGDRVTLKKPPHGIDPNGWHVHALPFDRSSLYVLENAREDSICVFAEDMQPTPGEPDDAA